MLTKTILSTLITTLVFSASSYSFAKKPNNIEFTESLITSPYKISQDIIAADILPTQGKELITFTVDEQGNRWLIVYTLTNDNNQYQIAEKAMIPKHFYRFDISKLSDSRAEEKTNNNNTSKGDEKATQQLYFLSTDSLAVYQQGKKNKFEKLSFVFFKQINRCFLAFLF